MRFILLSVIVFYAICLCAGSASANDNKFKMFGVQINTDTWEYTLTNVLPDTPENTGFLDSLDIWWSSPGLDFTVLDTPENWTSTKYFPDIVSFDYTGGTFALPGGASISGFKVKFLNNSGPGDKFIVYDYNGQIQIQDDIELRYNIIPEPGTLAVLTTALIGTGIAVVRRRLA